MTPAPRRGGEVAFPRYRLVVCKTPQTRSGSRSGQTRTIFQAVFSAGWRIRIQGDALCKQRWRFNGNLNNVRPHEERATCHDCIAAAERLSLVE